MEADHPTTTSGMLLLNGLPVRTQITLDAHSEAYLTNEQFVGIKSLPEGWHCVSWSLASSDAPTTTSEESASRGQGTSYHSEGSVRHVLMRWFDQAEVTVRELDRVQQRLVVPDQVTRSSGGSSIGRSHRRHLTRNLNLSSTTSVETLITPDVLNRIEPRLLPYPPAAKAPWCHATHHLSHSGGRIGRAVVARVLGIDTISGDSATDSLATGPVRAKDAREQASLQPLTAAAAAAGGRIEDGKIIWGKSRTEAEHAARYAFEEVDRDGQDEGESRFEPGVLGTAELKKRKRAEATQLANTTGDKDDEDDREDEEDDGLQFTSFDLRRSWPPSSVGAEITRWSEDKSWLLQDVARRSWSGLVAGSTTLDAAMDTEMETGEMFVALLCEFELAFVLFVAAGNAYAWEQWRELMTLFCRASSFIGAPSTFQLHPSTTAPAAEATSSMNAIRLDAHIAFLTALHAQLSLLDPTFWTDQASAMDEAAVQSEIDVLRANIARALAGAAARSNSQTDTGQLVEQQSHLIKAWRRLSHSTSAKFGWQLDRRLDEEAEVEDDLDAEDGEDAPVIVET